MTDAQGPPGPYEPNQSNPFGSGESRALDPDMPVVGAADQKPARSGRPWVALGAAALVVLVIGGGALVLRSFLSTSVGAAEVMPPDTELFFSVDFLQLIEGDARQLNDTIISMVEASGQVDSEDLRDVDGLVGEIDLALEDALGVDFTEDIRPWVGRTVSLSMSGIDGLSSGDVPDVLLVVEARDGSAADQFLSDFAQGLARATGADVSEGTYNGVPIFVASDEFDFDPPLLFARIGSMVTFGTQQAVEDAIDTEAGSSLADNEGFAAVMAGLPSDRIMSFYLNGAAFTQALETEGLGVETLDGFGFDDMGASLSIADFGVRVDTLVLGDDPTGGIDFVPGDVVGDLPLDTLVMFGGWSVASYWEAVASALGGTETDELLADAEADVGIDFGRFLSLLDGPSALALVKTPEGLMAEQLGYPIGLMSLFGTTQAAEVKGYVEDIVDYVAAGGFEDLTRTTLGTGTFWIAGFDGQEAGAIGVTDEYLVATSSGELAALIGSSPSLSDNVLLQAVSEAMGVDPATVVLFVDTQALVDVFEAPSEMSAALAPLGPLAASYQVEPDRVSGVFVWLIDYVNSE